MLRNLKQLNVHIDILTDMYYKHCRNILELAVPAWNPGLTKAEINQLERVQKAACAIMLGPQYKTYNLALKQLAMERLDTRRETICLNFGKKVLNSEEFCNWFNPNEGNKVPPKTRKQKTLIVDPLKSVTTRTQRFQKSPIPYLTNLLNNNTK